MSYFYICFMTYIDQIQPPPSPSLISYNHDSLFYFLLDFYFPLSSPPRFPPFTFLLHQEHDTSDHWCLIYFIYHNVLQFRPFFCKWQHFILHWQVLLLCVYCVYLLYFHYPFICWLLPRGSVFNWGGYCCSKVGGTDVSLNAKFISFGHTPQRRYLNYIYGKSVFSFSKKKKTLTVLHNGCAELDSKPCLRVFPLTTLSCQSWLVLLLW